MLDDAILDTADSLDRLRCQQASAQLLYITVLYRCTREVTQPVPQAATLAPLVVIESATPCPPRALMLAHHRLDQADRREVQVTTLLTTLHEAFDGERQGDLIEHLQR